jgi:ubiquitin-protein ligase E3 C
MTSQFDMQSFIPAVVAEEEDRHRMQEADDEDDEQTRELGNEDTPAVPQLIGTRRTQQNRHMEQLRIQQKKASRKRYMQAVAPRLEILQNMPFFIPFNTRVQIFREFVHLDQQRRRNGHVDPDNWRMSVMQQSMMQRPGEGPSGHDIISKHHAKIHRESVFEDAFDQFYPLGEGLKEPIQITFVDKFDTVEAGIDGGGVTKEFLTSVTSEAFSAEGELHLFAENDQHLLFPNPASIEMRKDALNGIIQGGSPEWYDDLRGLIKRYEFLGRVIGKCLYEGILVDVGFAGFFLLKWALTGGSNAASKESGYRANINDLRDLDEQLYQGLVSPVFLLWVESKLTLSSFN